MAQNTNKIIYTRRIATRLIEMGNIPVGTTPNPSKPEFLCWIFELTPKFDRDLKILMENRPEKPKRAFKISPEILYENDNEADEVKE